MSRFEAVDVAQIGAKRVLAEEPLPESWCQFGDARSRLLTDGLQNIEDMTLVATDSEIQINELSSVVWR